MERSGSDTSALIWRGRAEAQLESLAVQLESIRMALKEVSDDIAALNRWRYQVLGLAMAWASVAAFVVTVVIGPLVTWLAMKVFRVAW